MKIPSAFYFICFLIIDGNHEVSCQIKSVSEELELVKTKIAGYIFFEKPKKISFIQHLKVRYSSKGLSLASRIMSWNLRGSHISLPSGEVQDMQSLVPSQPVHRPFSW
jgi:hypothetical protein